MGQMVRLMEGHPDTPDRLAGVGDMYVTSTGGRSVRVGRLVGSDLTFSEARSKMAGGALECAATIEVIGGALLKLTERGIIEPTDFPLMRHLHVVIAKDQHPKIPWGAFFGGEA